MDWFKNTRIAIYFLSCVRRFLRYTFFFCYKLQHSICVIYAYRMYVQCTYYFTSNLAYRNNQYLGEKTKKESPKTPGYKHLPMYTAYI